MTTITKQTVFLQYPKAGEIGPTGHRVSEGKFGDAEKFVALDSQSGGYPYAVDIECAHDFKTVEKAETYRGHLAGLTVRQVTTKYEF